MVIFQYDKTFDGLLSCLFEAYRRKIFPDVLLGQGEALPLFCEEFHRIVTDEAKAGRVWAGLKRRLSASALASLPVCWLSDLPEVDGRIFRYMRKNFDASGSQEVNFGDPDVLTLAKIYRKVQHECERLVQFARFQRAADGVYLAVFEPLYNVLPLAVEHFSDRFSDQKWMLYDRKREYGYYYDLETVQEMKMEFEPGCVADGRLQKSVQDADEELWQQLWKTYFKSVVIEERRNPRLHKQNMPVRFWKYLTEKQ